MAATFTPALRRMYPGEALRRRSQSQPVANGRFFTPTSIGAASFVGLRAQSLSQLRFLVGGEQTEVVDTRTAYGIACLRERLAAPSVAFRPITALTVSMNGPAP